MKKQATAICVLLGVAAGSYVFAQAVTRAERADTDRAQAYEQAKKAHESTIGLVEAALAKAETPEQWDEVRTRAASLPADAKKHFGKSADIATMEYSADTRDRLLYNTGALMQSNENDPDIPRNMLQAQKLADEIVKLLARIGDSPDKERQYREAYELYRSLAFIGKDEHHKALDIIAEAMVALRRANVYAPKDIRVEYAIEFLYKRAKQEEQKRGGSSSGQGDRPRALPTRPNSGEGDRRADRQHRH